MIEGPIVGISMVSHPPPPQPLPHEEKKNSENVQRAHPLPALENR